MQWDGSRYAGFSDARPWIGIPENHTYINVEDEKKDPDSIFHYSYFVIRITTVSSCPFLSVPDWVPARQLNACADTGFWSDADI